MRVKKRIFGLPFLTQERQDDGLFTVRLGKKTLWKRPVPKMRLGVSYNLYDGEELLRASIRAIRPAVDFVNVVYQDISNLGERRETVLPLLEQLKSEGLVDSWIAYEPDLRREPRVNESRKRVSGLEASRAHGCNYHLDMDVDEFYRLDEFRRAQEFILATGYETTACWIENYLGSPRYRLLDRDDLFVPFIIRIPKHCVPPYRGEYPILADFTRTLRRNGRFFLFPRDMINMHHMSLVRKDLKRKLANSTFNNPSIADVERQAQNEQRRSRASFVFGGHEFPPNIDFCGRDPVLLVEDEFGIGEVCACSV